MKKVLKKEKFFGLKENDTRGKREISEVKEMQKKL